jgi:uncharacterized membrane protein
MEPAVNVALLWGLFAGTHMALTSNPLRGALVARLGERGFDILFSLVASISFALLVFYYAAHRFEGAAGLAIGHAGALSWVLLASIAGGFALASGALVSYPRSPYALFNEGTAAASGPRGIERVTRHGFLVGVILVAVPHVLLATRLVGTVFTAGFVVLAALGAWHQDRKLVARRGPRHADYVARTSVIPFAAVVRGRQRVVWSELPLLYLAGGLVAAVLLRYVHDQIFAWGGAAVVAAVTLGAAAEGVQSWRRARRRRAALRPQSA